jgi:signal transduction histidine kinase
MLAGDLKAMTAVDEQDGNVHGWATAAVATSAVATSAVATNAVANSAVANSAVANSAVAFTSGTDGVEEDPRRLQRDQRKRRQRLPRVAGGDNQAAVNQQARLAVLGQRLAVLAHESRSLLQRASSSLEMLELELTNQPQVWAGLERAQQAVMGLRRLLAEVQGYASPLVLQREWYSVAGIWREAWELVAPLNRQRNCELIERPGALAAWSYVDRFQLTQVFRNLFENSFAAALGSPRIEIDGRMKRWRDIATVEFTIRDNGSGVSCEQRRRIFEPFVTTKPRGTGLGLAIARRIAEAHGGELVLGPPRPVGTEMRLTLPATHRPA